MKAPQQKITQASLLSELAGLIDKKRFFHHSIVSSIKRTEEAKDKVEQIEESLYQLLEQKANLKEAPVISLIEYRNIETLASITQEELKFAKQQYEERRRILFTEEATLVEVEERIKYVSNEAAKLGRVIEFPK